MCAPYYRSLARISHIQEAVLKHEWGVIQMAD
jgi:hypothetical protein